MNRNEGLKNKYKVERFDGRPVGQCIVLEFSDTNSHAAIATWADTVEADGYAALAHDVREQLAASYVAMLGNPLVPKTTLVDGLPVTPDHAVINPATGMQNAYVVLSDEEIAKGFVRPMRNTYTHIVCGTSTTMAHALAATYARDPYFYTGTFCAHCHDHFPVDEFVWEGSTEKVGS